MLLKLMMVARLKKIDDAVDVVSDDDRPVNGTYYINCQAVYANSFNAKGVKVRDSGNLDVSAPLR